MKKKFGDFDELREYTKREIKVFKYETFFLVQIGKLLTIVSDNPFDTELTMIGVSSDFETLEKQDGKSREIELENFCYSNGREDMPTNVLKAIANYFGVDLEDDLNQFLKFDQEGAWNEK